MLSVGKLQDSLWFWLDLSSLRWLEIDKVSAFGCGEGKENKPFQGCLGFIVEW